MPFDIISVNFNDDTVTFIPKFCTHIKTIPIINLLDKQGHRYCGACYEPFGIESYNKIKECIKEKECIMLTTKEEFMELNSGMVSKIKIIGKCNHEFNIVYWEFLNGRALCSPCLNIHRSITRKQFYTENKDYAQDVELKGNDLFRKYLSEKFEIVCISSCLADMLIKPKSILYDQWLPIQLKATIQKDSRYVYKFVIKNKNYTNIILVCICISEEKFWIFEGKNIPKTDAVNIFNKTEESKCIYNKYYIPNNELLPYMMKLYTESKINNSIEVLSVPITPSNKLEYKYKLIREEKFKDILTFQYPETDSHVYDFLVNNLKVQEKIASIDESIENGYRAYIRKTKDRKSKKPYNEKDNDLYWFHIVDTNIFYIVPNEIMIKLKYVTTDIQPGKTAILLYPNYKKKKTILSLELNQYQFDYNNIDKTKIKELFKLV